MATTSDKTIISKPFFSHDVFTREQDTKIKQLFFVSRKEGQEKAWAAYGVFWGIVEHLHHSAIRIEDVEMLADDWRVGIEILRSVLDDFGLFKKEDGFYVSERVIRNLGIQQEASENGSKNAHIRWEKRRQLIEDMIAYFTEIFEKDFIASDKVKKAISEILNKNKEVFIKDKEIDTWKKIINEANKGWDFADDKHSKPTFNYILNNWSAILSGDCNFAEDKKAAAAKKEENERLKQLNKEAKKKLDLGIENTLFVYDDYRCSISTVKLEAQKIYTETLPQGEDEAIKAACMHCKEQVKEENV